MGSTGEPDRKRRHFSSISPTATAAKKQLPFVPSEEMKIDVPVLQYRNKKLVQQLEAQKVEYFALEGKFHHLVEKKATYDDTLEVISESWEQLVGDLESHSVGTREPEGGGCDMKTSHMNEDGASSFLIEEDFLSRLLETGATESCCDVLSPSQMEDVRTAQATTRNILQNIVTSINCLWRVNSEVVSALCMILPEDESNIQLRKAANDLQLEVQSFQMAIRDLHLKHRPLANKVQFYRDMDAKNKAERKLLSGELASTVAELEEINCKLTNLKAQKDAAPGSSFLFPPLGNKQAEGDKLRDKQKELQDLESALKDMKDVASSRLVDIRSLHEERIDVLKRLADLQSSVTDVQSITSSKAFLLLIEQLDKSKAEMDQCRTSLEKLQVEKDNLIWHGKEVTVRADLADAYRRFSTFSDSHIAELEQQNLQKILDKRILLEGKLELASKEPGWKQIIAEFKSLVSSLPKDMTVMQSELSKYKEAASEIHCLRADVQSLSSMLNRKVIQLESLSGRSAQQFSEIKKLQAVVRDLRESDQELKLILEMYRRESTDTREVMESRDAEYKAWAHVQSLKSSLDEHNLELRVKEANEAEAISQQRLATTEAEIADLRQNLESSGRDICHSSEALKSKHEEGDTYLSEIESIGQAYEDMQTQNQHLLQQVTERDDYNIKLVMEGTKARQLHDALSREVHTMDRKILHANSFLDLFHEKVARFDDQLKIWSDQVGRLVEDGWHNSTSLGNFQRRLTDIEREYQQIRESLGERQTQAAKSRLDVTELLIELEKERFNKKRIEEGFEVMTRKATSLREQMEGSTVLGKLKQEIKEYRGILKCRICHDRQKEVVIAKCYHLFCSQCVQRTLESRHRKCPSCGASFGPNDVKPVYI